MGEETGARTTDLVWVQMHPTGLPGVPTAQDLCKTPSGAAPQAFCWGWPPTGKDRGRSLFLSDRLTEFAMTPSKDRGRSLFRSDGLCCGPSLCPSGNGPGRSGTTALAAQQEQLNHTDELPVQAARSALDDLRGETVVTLLAEAWHREAVLDVPGILLDVLSELPGWVELGDRIEDRALPHSANGEHGSGDDVTVGEETCATTIDMEWVLMLPTGFAKSDDADAGTELLAANVLRGEAGSILSAAVGARFAWQDDASYKNNGPKGNQVERHGNTKLSSSSTTSDDSNALFDRGKCRAGGVDKGGINEHINHKSVDESINEDVDKLMKIGMELRNKVPDPPTMISQLVDVDFSAPGRFSTTSYANKVLLDRGGSNKIINDKSADESIDEDVDKMTRVGMEIRDKITDTPLMISQLSDVGVTVPGGFSTTSHAYNAFTDKGGFNKIINDELADDSIDEDVDNLMKVGPEIRDKPGGFSTLSHAYKDFLDRGGINEFINDEPADVSIYEGADNLTQVGQEIHDKITDPSLMIPQRADVGISAPGGFSTTSHANKELLDKGGINENIIDKLADESIYEDMDKLMKVGMEIRDKVPDRPLMISKLVDVGVPAPGGFRTTSHAYNDFPDKGDVNEVVNDNIADASSYADQVGLNEFIHDQLADESTYKETFEDAAGLKETVGQEIRDKIMDHPFQANFENTLTGYNHLVTAAHFGAESSTGAHVNGCNTDALTTAVDALAYCIDLGGEETMIAYPNLLFDRNIFDGHSMMCSFLTLTVGINRGAGEIEYGKIYDLYVPPAFLRLYGVPVVSLEAVWHIPDKGTLNGDLGEGITIKSKLGTPPRHFGEACYASWQVGDFIKYDERQGHQVFCHQNEFIPEDAKAMRAAIGATGNGRLFLAHTVVDDPNEMIDLGMYYLSQLGPLLANCAFLADGYVTGGTAETYARRSFPQQNTRAQQGYTAFVHTKISQVVGVSAIHTGTMRSGKMEGDAADKNTAFMLQAAVADGPYRRQEWEGMKLTAPIISGGTNVLYQPSLFENMGHFNAILATRGEAAHLAAETSMGTNATVCTTDDSLADALVYCIDPDSEEMMIAYPNLLFDRNIFNSHGVMFPFLALAIGNNQSMGDVQCGKIYDLYMSPAFLRLYDAPVVNLEDMWRIRGKGTLNGGLGAGTTIKPTLGLQPRPLGKACCAFWPAGDFSKNDEPEDNQVFRQANECTPEVVKAMRVTITETGYGKLFSANITAEDPNEMNASGQYCLSQLEPLLENCAFMVDGYAAGCTTATCARRNFPQQFLHYRRAGHGFVTGTQTQHDYTAFMYTNISQVVGASGIHTGTMRYGKMEGDASDKHMAFMLQDAGAFGPCHRQEWEGMKLTTLFISGGKNTSRLPSSCGQGP